jgi:hypothetical protein
MLVDLPTFTHARDLFIPTVQLTLVLKIKTIMFIAKVLVTASAFFSLASAATTM